MKDRFPTGSGFSFIRTFINFTEINNLGMFNFFKTQHIYIRIFTDKIQVRHLEKNRTVVRDAIEKFSSERSLIATLSTAESLAFKILHEISGKKMLSPALNVLIQPMDKVEGGISEIETVLLSNFGEHLGGKKVVVYENKEMLSDDQVMAVLGSK